MVPYGTVWYSGGFLSKGPHQLKTERLMNPFGLGQRSPFIPVKHVPYRTPCGNLNALLDISSDNHLMFIEGAF